MNVDLAYVFGVFLGDGNAQKYHRKDGKGYNYAFRLSVIDEDFARETEKRCRVLGFDSLSIYETMNNYGHKVFTLHCRSKILVELLLTETSSKLKIPSVIKSSSKEIKRAFLAGFMDSEGWVQISKKKQIQVGFCGTSDWIEEIARMFQSLGVVVGKKRTENPESRQGEIKSKKPLHRYLLRTESFIQSGCYFTIARKQERLRDYNAVSERRDKREELFERFKEKSIRLSNRKAGYELGVSHETIRSWREKVEKKEPLYLVRMKG